MESFSAEEQTRLAPYFTNVDRPVFALVNLPEVVKGALFARYSRSPKSVRRLFLDEFVGTAVRSEGATPAEGIGVARAESLFERVFVEYGDDSVAQLGGVHLACEGVSNVLTKLLEWGRLMAYLEQSTRYVPYDDQPGGRYRYHVPAELEEPLRGRYVATLDQAFDTYRVWLPRLRDYYEARFPRAEGDSEQVHRLTIRAKALDTLASVWLIDPQHGATVGRTFALHVSGATFESTIQLRVRQGDRTVSQKYVTVSTTSTGRFGEAKTTFTLSPGGYVIEAYAESAVDGRVAFLDDHSITVS